MNIALEQTEEYVNGQLKNKYGISEEDLTKDEYEKIIEDAHEWFMIHFFEEQGLE